MKSWFTVAVLAILMLGAGEVSAQKAQNSSDDTQVVTIKRDRDPVQKFLEFIAKDRPDDIQVTEAANLRTLADQAGYDGQSPVNLRFVVPENVTITGKPGGGVAIDTGEWPVNATVTLIVKGNVYGGGGNGGDGGPTPMPTAGGPGGDGISVHAVVSIAIVKGASIKGGGGGGGGGSAKTGGGGGGGGFPNGKGGRGAMGGAEGRQATVEWGGRGGNNRHNGAMWSTLVETWSGVPDPYHSGGPGAGAASNGRPAEGGNGGEAATDGYDGNLPEGRTGGPAGYAIRVNSFEVKLITGGSVWGHIG